MSLPVDGLAAAFVQIADTLTESFDLAEFLAMVTTHTSDVVDVAGVGLLLAASEGRLELMAASDQRTTLLELFQVHASEGPCQDCFRLGHPVVDADLGAPQALSRWPAFAPQAVRAGYRSVHAFPLRLRGEVIGALNLFGTRAGLLEAVDVRVVQALADAATIGLLQERALRRSELLSRQLQTALTTRTVIEQAKGALAQIHACTPDEAFVLLRAHCRSHRLRIADVSRSVVSDPTSVASLTQPRRSGNEGPVARASALPAPPPTPRPAPPPGARP